jgi:aminobenzoyl-glutamate utilization protein B
MRTALMALTLIFMAAPAMADPATLKRDAAQWVDRNTAALEKANRNIWTWAEPSLSEHKSSKELQDLLKANGFKVEAGVAGMPTAFVATYGNGAPVIGILAEFDALLGVSQSDAPTPAPGANLAAGHACGHSLFGVGSTAAAIAVKQLIAAGKLKGTVKLYGTPAEETGIGKVYMLRAGYFRDDDAILHWHPSINNMAPFSSTKALVNVRVRFTGQQAHASAQPWAGRSALDAIELLSVGVNYMREHIKSDARIHSVITQGGGQPNVVPGSAEAWYYIRADKFDDVLGYFSWFKQIAEGAALMTQTTLEPIQIMSETHEIVPNRPLSEAVHRNLTAVGAPQWTPEELAFAARTQREFKDPFGLDYTKSGIALASRIEALPDQPRRGEASTDVGDISWFVPTAGLMIAAYGYGLPTHSWPVIAASGTSIGTKALVTAAKVLSATTIDLMTDPALVQAAKQDFATTMKGVTWKTAIPEGQQAPTGLGVGG